MSVFETLNSIQVKELETLNLELETINHHSGDGDRLTFCVESDASVEAAESHEGSTGVAGVGTLV
ncbi:hypothetical protein GCM10028810_40800 [Spirosoma litoris]